MNNLDTKDNKIASTSTEDSSQTEVTSNHGMESKTDFSNMDLNSNWTFIFNFYSDKKKIVQALFSSRFRLMIIFPKFFYTSSINYSF